MSWMTWRLINMKVLMIFTNGLEECEGLIARDIFMRSGLEVEMMNINDEEEIISSHQLEIKVKPFHEDVDEFAALVIPGGKAGTINNDSSSRIDDLLNKFAKEGKLIAAICAAPSILGKRDYLKGKRYTCYPGWQDESYGIYTGEEVVKDEKFITGRSMYYTSQFALEIVEYLLGKDTRIKIENQIKGIK